MILAGEPIVMPTVAYYLSTSDHPIDADHPLWKRPFPISRRCVLPGSATDGSATVSYGDYFSAVHRFCATAEWRHLASACAIKLERPVTPHDISRLEIHLEKHGAFYHPSRLRVSVCGTPVSLVVNVAVSEEGRRTLPHEVRALNRLADERPFGWFPRVYRYGVGPVPMMMADWFDGYHEFHLTRPVDEVEPRVVLWDGSDRLRLLTPTQTDALYRNAAMILTASYDPITSRQIHPWHHAAGDFVLRLNGNRVAVKLITVRDYSPLTETGAAIEDEGALLEALTVFLLHLSMRMRLDRLDGVSEVIWAPDGCLKPMVEGFFQGLDLTSRLNGFPEGFPELVRLYFNRYEADDLVIMANRIAASVFAAQAEEQREMRRHVEAHVRALSRILSAGNPKLRINKQIQ